MTDSFLKKKVFNVIKDFLKGSIPAFGGPIQNLHRYICIASERINDGKPLISFLTEEDKEIFPWMGSCGYSDDIFLVFGMIELGTGFVYGHIGATKTEIAELEKLFTELNSNPKFFFLAICEAFIECLLKEKKQ